MNRDCDKCCEENKHDFTKQRQYYVLSQAQSVELDCLGSNSDSPTHKLT